MKNFLRTLPRAADLRKKYFEQYLWTNYKRRVLKEVFDQKRNKKYLLSN